MSLKRLFSGRYAVVISVAVWFLATSLLLRFIFMCWNADGVSLSLADIAKTLLVGLFFDVGVLSFLCIPATIYYTFLPTRFVGGRTDRIVHWILVTLTIFILVFVFFAEVTFWDEFQSRFNFIAVDYLIYTNEVVANINQSYPLPILIMGVVLITLLVL
ncbi:MAG: LTA synthase family protein, partial [Proteobacteria bacterium]